MSFKDWLPITTRNRVALGLSAVALVTFMVWNCLPSYAYGATEPEGMIAVTLWPEVFSSEIFLMVLKDPHFESFLAIATVMALIQNGLITLAAVPFWKHLHASPYIRLPLAVVNLLGCAVILWHLRVVVTSESPSRWAGPLMLMSLNMFALSAALFTFRNELGLRSEKEVREVSGRGGAA